MPTKPPRALGPTATGARLALTLFLSGCAGGSALPAVTFYGALGLVRHEAVDRTDRRRHAEGAVFLSWRTAGPAPRSGDGPVEAIAVEPWFQGAEETCAPGTLCAWEHDERHGALDRLAGSL